MVVKGLIQMDQIIAVYLILDDGSPVHGFDIEGDSAYVDQGINTTIGSQTIGSNVIGGGGEVTIPSAYLSCPALCRASTS